VFAIIQPAGPGFELSVSRVGVGNVLNQAFFSLKPDHLFETFARP
jgi:hypothetical protein